MQKIIPHLWFDKEAKEATAFYASVFPDSKINTIRTIKDTPSGDCDMVNFTLFGQKFMAISAGPYFKLNPSISFFVNFDPLFFGDVSKTKESREALDTVWGKLSEGGTVLMPLDKYPFSDRYGWIQDKYGVSWQLILGKTEGEERPPIVPSLMFIGDKCGKAEEASNFYTSVFKDSRKGLVARYPAGSEPNKEGTIMFTDFKLIDTWFAAMDSAREHGFTFNEAISFIVNCNTQEEIDYYWEKLSKVPASEQCGWCKDQYGVSWQIVPTVMDDMMTKGSPEQIARVTQAFLKMKKFDIKTLEEAYEGK